MANAADINFASSVAEQYGRYEVRINTVQPRPGQHRPVGHLEKAFARDKGVTQGERTNWPSSPSPSAASASRKKSPRW